MLARCAGPDKYYPLIETLFQQQPKWAVRQPLPPLLAIAKQAGFTEKSFNDCLNDTALLNKVQQERDVGSNKFKVEATPTFFINGQRYSGEMSIADLDKLLEPLIPKA
jgi:protein-disulfide isomerase